MRAAITALVLLLSPLVYTACAQETFMVDGVAVESPRSSLASKRPEPTPLREYPTFTPLEDYRALMDSAAACAGVDSLRSFDEIVWVQAPGRNFWAPGVDADTDSMPSIGLWQPGEGQDTIVIGAEWKTTDWVVKHELIHYLLQRGHPADTAEDKRIWGEQCHAMWGHLQ